MSEVKYKKINPKTNTILRGDNLEIMRAMPDGLIDLCYIDPPFFTQKDYKNIWGDKQSVLDWSDSKLDGFFDTKDFFEKHIMSGETGLEAYLAWLRLRFMEIHRLLKSSGTLYVHLDYHAVHYAKAILDDVFGYKNYLNEIVWRRKSGSNNTSKNPKNFSNNCDYILIYTKSKNYSFNLPYKKHTEEFREKYYNKKDEKGRYYKIENLGAPSFSPTLIFDFKGFKTPSNGWRWTKERMKKADAAGLLHYCYNGEEKGSIKQKVYFDGLPGMPVENIWDDIMPLTAGDKERTGWPTQKPVALLERIINTSSKEGDVIFDCFAGCGTAMHAAHNLKRKWIGIDISPKAIEVNKKRLEELGAKVNVADEKDFEKNEKFKISYEDAA